ncbi:hydantoinase B/oxoprolinase family protein [Aminobacter niigataensis]|uniref:hydantoinase B/oxoprolinase family protein n=1 Tax=Aminobacter niigataensis TaxID=83265 RepID=UPI0024CD52E8|nr:hydantoinase B/oxoprolinase family protein [Aminobacter niigataensis]CAI2931843.1 N-methylhydantoinase B [Aminobacter niigataensis]
MDTKSIGQTDPRRNRRSHIDPVTHEILQGKLLSIVDEMAIVMTKTSMSPVIYEVLDFACGICDSHGALIAQTNGITLFTGTFAAQVKSVIETFGRDLAPGDVIVTNDPFRGGTHACDFAIVRPVFASGEIIAFAINVAHWLDVGGAIPGSLPPNAISVFQEGLRLPCVRIVRDETIVMDILQIIKENVRLPDMAVGDLNAQLATVRIAERRLLEIVRRYGAATLQLTFDVLMDDSELQARAAISALPDGEYTAVDTIDEDGVGGQPIEVTVRVRIEGDRMEVDFTGCPPAAAGPINCARGALNSAVKTIFKALVAPQDPSNEGWFRPLTVTAPPGTIFTAEKPSPTGWYYEGSVHASELVWKALAPIVPHRFSAGSYTSLCVTYISGRDDAGNLFVHIEPEHGGWGACCDQDGASALISLTDGDTYNYSIELIEAKFPLLVRRYALNTDGGAGAGRYRGGYGLVREYQIRGDDAEIYCGFGRTDTPPWPMEGGQEGSTNYLEVLSEQGDRVKLRRSPTRTVWKGDLIRIVTGGGGGWGNASERETEAIAADIRDELISIERARTEYPQAAALLAAGARHAEEAAI